MIVKCSISGYPMYIVMIMKRIKYFTFRLKIHGGPPSLSELTTIIFYMELIHLGSKTSK